MLDECGYVYPKALALWVRRTPDWLVVVTQTDDEGDEQEIVLTGEQADWLGSMLLGRNKD
jgi:hypothetical protein